MEPQVWIFYLYLFLAAVVLLVFVVVALSARQPRDVPPEKVSRLRFGFFVLVTVVLVAALGLTLSRMPYDLWEDEIPDKVIFVAGKQFAFAVSETPVTSEAEWEERTMSAAVELAAGSLAEIRVTSLDVNHSLGIYDPSGVLIGQVQGMPGYVNRLRVRFERPGRYDFLCLELCGMGHSRMLGVVQVVGAAGAPGER